MTQLLYKPISVKLFVAAPLPIVLAKPATVGACQTRAQ